MQAAAGQASLNADLSRPATGSAAARGFEADLGPATDDADSLGMSAPKAIPPKQLADAWENRTPKAAEVEHVSYESDDHKPGATEFLAGVEQNIDEEDRVLVDQQEAEVAQA